MVTRPRQQATKLLTQLKEHGFNTFHFPTIEIDDDHGSEQNVALMKQLDTFQMAIFISQNAVIYGLRLLQLTNCLSQLPPVAVIGRSTRQLLEQHHIPVAVCPPLPNSETLLNMPELKRLSPGSRLLIFRGHGGKETLAKTLQSRQIKVQYAEVYRRLKPTPTTLSLSPNPPDLIMVTSLDSLQNLFDLTIGSDIEQLRNTPVIIGSQSMMNLYTDLAFKRPPIVADTPLDEDMIQAVVQWQNTKPSP